MSNIYPCLCVCKVLYLLVAAPADVLIARWQRQQYISRTLQRSLASDLKAAAAAAPPAPSLSRQCGGWGMNEASSGGRPPAASPPARGGCHDVTMSRWYNDITDDIGDGTVASADPCSSNFDIYYYISTIIVTGWEGGFRF